MTKEQKEFCIRFYDKTGIDLDYEVENDMPRDIDAFMDMVQERVNEEEVIYYSNAMEYLTENDPSLQASLGLAHDMGCTLENLNSETLATLLKQENLRSEVEEYRDEIEKLFYSED